MIFLPTMSGHSTRWKAWISQKDGGVWITSTSALQLDIHPFLPLELLVSTFSSQSGICTTGFLTLRALDFTTSLLESPICKCRPWDLSASGVRWTYSEKGSFSWYISYKLWFSDAFWQYRHGRKRKSISLRNMNQLDNPWSHIYPPIVKMSKVLQNPIC